MDNNKLRSYVSRLTNCTSDYEESSPFLESDHLKKLVTKGDMAFFLDISQYKKILRSLIETEEWGERFTDEYINKELRNFLFRIREEGNNRNAVTYFTELVNEVEGYKQEQTVYIPLAGIKLNIDSLELGNVTLFQMTNEQYDTLAEQMKSIMVNQDMTEEQKQQYVQIWLGRLQNQVCAKYVCTAEPDRARQRANDECQRVFDLLQFSIHMMGQDHYRITVGQLGDVNRYTRTIPVFSSDAQRFVLNSQVVGPLAEFIISTQTVEKMHHFGIFKVAELLKRKVDEDSFEEMLLRGLRWFSNAQIQVVRENRFLNLMTCLETFLTRRDMEQITNTVAEGVAFVLGTGLAERKLLKRRVLEFYNHRSRISHEGHNAILSSDLEEFTSMVGDFLEKMIQKKTEFKNRKDLEEWIENQKFGI